MIDASSIVTYTGISKPLFEWLLKFGPQDVVSKKLNLDDHHFLTLVKLRRGLTNQDLAYRANISASAMSKVLRHCIVKFAHFVAN